MCGKKVSILSVAFIFLLASGLSIRMDPVIAQESDENEVRVDIEEVVVVEASIDAQSGPRPATGYKTGSAELKRYVSFADLDLSIPADALVLEQRIEVAAQEACETLERTFPLGQKSMADVRRCTKRAIEGTKEAFETAVASAN
jgi:UrcA family protein